MAWKEACEIEACKHIDRLRKQEGMTVRQALKATEHETDIPASTLSKWYYPRHPETKPKPKAKPEVVAKNGHKEKAKPKAKGEAKSKGSKVRMINVRADIVSELEQLIEKGIFGKNATVEIAVERCLRSEIKRRRQLVAVTAPETATIH